jgi:hypothetical protein
MKLGMAAIGLVVLLTACSAGRFPVPASPSSSSSAATMDANSTCALEITEEAGVLATGDAAWSGLITAIGSESEQFHLANLILGPMNQLIASQGVSSAIPQITTVAKSACAQTTNPLLTRGQQQSLLPLVPQDNATAMQVITLFADTSVPINGTNPMLPAAGPVSAPANTAPSSTTSSSPFGPAYQEGYNLTKSGAGPTRKTGDFGCGAYFDAHVTDTTDKADWVAGCQDGVLAHAGG